MNDRAYWVEPSQLSLHPVAELFPEMTASEFDAFRSHFDEHGQQEPVVVDEARRIVDGRHRWRAAESLGKSVWVQFTSELGIHTEEGVLQYAIAKNLHRRHLNESQRAMVAASLSGPARTGRRKKGANLQLSVEQAAESMQVSPRSVSDARKVAEKGAPALVEAVKKGTVKVSTAAKVVEQTTPEEQERVLAAAGPEGVKAQAREITAAKKSTTKDTKSTKWEDDVDRYVRDLTVLERGFLAANGYEPEANPYEEVGTCYLFMKILKKTKTERKREVDVCFCWVDGYTPERTGERFVASWSIPGGGVGAGGGTLGFYLTVEEAVAAAEHWIETGEYLPESVARKGEEEEECTTKDTKGTKGEEGGGASPSMVRGDASAWPAPDVDDAFIGDIEEGGLDLPLCRAWMRVRTGLIDGLFDLLYGGTDKELLSLAQRAAALPAEVQARLDWEFREGSDGITPGEVATREFIAGWFSTRLDEMELPTEGHGTARKGEQEEARTTKDTKGTKGEEKGDDGGAWPSLLDVALLEALGFERDECKNWRSGIHVWISNEFDIDAVFECGSWTIETAESLVGYHGPRLAGLLAAAGAFSVGADPDTLQILSRVQGGGFRVSDTLPARVAGLTEGSPFHSVAEEGFDFGALCRGLEIMNYAGTIEDLVERGRPTQDQMDYLHVMLPQVLSWLADVSDAIAAGIGAASTVAGGLEAHPTDGVEVGALEVAG